MLVRFYMIYKEVEVGVGKKIQFHNQIEGLIDRFPIKTFHCFKVKSKNKYFFSNNNTNHQNLV